MIAEATLKVSRGSWILVMDDLNNPATKRESHLSHLVGDMLWIEHGCDIDSLQVAFSFEQYTNEMVEYNRYRTQKQQQYASFKVFFVMPNDKEKQWMECLDCVLQTEKLQQRETLKDLK